MNQKFEKFKSKEISRQDSEKFVGGDYFECLLGCEMWAVPYCATQGGSFGECVFKETAKCHSKCVVKELIE